MIFWKQLHAPWQQSRAPWGSASQLGKYLHMLEDTPIAVCKLDCWEEVYDTYCFNKETFNLLNEDRLKV